MKDRTTTICRILLIILLTALIAVAITAGIFYGIGCKAHGKCSSSVLLPVPETAKATPTTKSAGEGTSRQSERGGGSDSTSPPERKQSGERLKEIGQALKQEAQDIFAATPRTNIERHKRLVEQINKANSTWKAEYNPSAPIPLGLDEVDYGLFVAQIDMWFKQLKAQIMLHSPYKKSDLEQMDLPVNFDSREKWPRCSYLQRPSMNQGACGSCWVVSTLSMMSDRICIHSNQTLQIHLSAQDALAGQNATCLTGGFEPEVLMYMQTQGVVTGGPFGSNDGCVPYEHASACGSPCTPKYFAKGPLAKPRRCRPGYKKSYEDDKWYVFWPYRVTDEVDRTTPSAIKDHLVKAEIFNRGPVTAHMVVSEDFLHYKSGVYQFIGGQPIYGHAVKVIGWGVEKGVDYWLVANSFGSDWGDNGFFKISMSNDTDAVIVPISTAVNTGLPDFTGKIAGLTDMKKYYNIKNGDESGKWI